MNRATATNPAAARVRKKIRTRQVSSSAEGSKLQTEIAIATLNTIISDKGSGKFRHPKKPSSSRKWDSPRCPNSQPNAARKCDGARTISLICSRGLVTVPGRICEKRAGTVAFHSRQGRVRVAKNKIKNRRASDRSRKRVDGMAKTASP